MAVGSCAVPHGVALGARYPVPCGCVVNKAGANREAEGAHIQSHDGDDVDSGDVDPQFPVRFLYVCQGGLVKVGDHVGALASFRSGNSSLHKETPSVTVAWKRFMETLRQRMPKEYCLVPKTCLVACSQELLRK
jgi:hypothetical protein